MDQVEYLALVREAARWSEASGCRGMLVYSENGLVDPWLVAQVIIAATDRLIPLVAVQPVYMHPYAVAKMVASLAYMYERPVALNMVAGGFKNDLTALGDDTPHDQRYARLVEYAHIIRHLTTESKPLSFEGAYYRTRALRLSPGMPVELAPSFMISGSSEDGLAAARTVGATVVRYPQPPGEEYASADDGLPCGIRIGMIVDEDPREAWRMAYDRFPEDREGQIMHRLAMTTSDSVWHARLSQLAAAAVERNVAYWLGPFQNYQSYCPYLVGDFAAVSAELAGYMGSGVRTFILDIQSSQDELVNAARALTLAAQASS